MLKTLLYSIICYCLIHSVQAKTLTKNDIPEQLKPWINWVLFDQDDLKCPFLYNSVNQLECLWPSKLELNLNTKNAKFHQTWLVFKTSWVQIPGDSKRWPQNVLVNGTPANVLKRNNKPYIKLVPGNYTIKGIFIWDAIPDNLNIAANTGIIKLSINGKNVKLPKIQKNGQLWLREQDIGHSIESTASDNLDIKIFRKITDDIPLLMTTHIALNVSGQHREILLGKALLENFIPLVLESILPARIEANGRLRVQIRPGHWIIRLVARYPTELTELKLSRSAPPWPPSEIWVFDARHTVRVVEVQASHAIDPRQTNLPAQWINLPAYEMKPDRSFILKTIRRGDPDPSPNKLTLNRNIWLDFLGTGYTIKDHITGKMTRGWRIETQSGLELGRVSVNEQPQFITQLPNSKNTGIEIRNSNINIDADSRYTRNISRIPATGWKHDFQKVNTTLHIPPGWKIFSIFGVDNKPATWLQSWTLLDLFLVLIISLSIYRLWGKTWGIIALLTLSMVWHQDGAPQLIWLNILIAIALLRVMPDGKVKKVIATYRYISLLLLLLISIPFLISEIKSGLYPILEFQNKSINSTQFSDKDSRYFVSSVKPESSSKLKFSKSNKLNIGKNSNNQLQYSQSQNQLSQYDPKSNIQTGPGVPKWEWQTINLSWNGPVLKEQEIFLLLTPPNLNIAFHFIHAIFLSALILLMIGFRYSRANKFNFNISNIFSILIIFYIGFQSPEIYADTFPNKELLNTLKKRLIDTPDCLPICAQISRLKLKISNNKMTIRLEIHNQNNVSVPLPSQLNNWMPTKIAINGKPAKGIVRSDTGELRIYLPKGKHQVSLSGEIGNLNTIQLPLPLKPQRVEFDSSTWSIAGILKDSIPDQQLQLFRLRPRASQTQKNSIDENAFPPFVKITRTLHFGLDWRITTEVQRVTNNDNAIVFELPLIKGESITTEGIRVINNLVQVSLAINQNRLTWYSVLEKQVQIDLIASNTSKWFEIWRVDISPVWHLEADGLPIISHFLNNKFLPEWRPWPGERLILNIVKPIGLTGKTLTIDNSEIIFTPGSRIEAVELKLSLRSSQGGQHNIILPNNSILQNVTINNVQKPIRQNDREVTLPINPGTQNIVVQWRKSSNLEYLLQSPEVNIGISNVNFSTKINMPADRWILFVGSSSNGMGPAVLFWGEIILLIFISFGLSKINSIPLKFYHWMLLGVGLTQIPLLMSITIIAWLLSFYAREKYLQQQKPIVFNLYQIFIATLTIIALSFLFFAIHQGLLGHPDMQIAGNNSSSRLLIWFHDRAPALLPNQWVISVPLLLYRILMLVWALWIALSLINWLRWTWTCFSKDTLWKSMQKNKIIPESQALSTDHIDKS